MPSPNIWDHPAVYEVENRAFDRPRLVDATTRSVASWEGRDLLDLGCGSGFHLPRWASDSRRVLGVEPHPALVSLARRRCRSLPHVSVLQGSATDIPLPDASVDIVQVRWAYFFGPGSEPGLAELARVVRRGGTAFVVDNDATRSTFGTWFRRGYPAIDPDAVERFWSADGWTRHPVLTSWQFDTRPDLESVVRIEFDRETADAFLSSHQGLVVDYAVNVWSRAF